MSSYFGFETCVRCKDDRKSFGIAHFVVSMALLGWWTLLDNM
jgi:hypothetical protein